MAEKEIIGRALGHPQYLEEASKVLDMLKSDNIKILKADIFNEITLRHPIPGGILLNLKHCISLSPTGSVVLGELRSTIMELHAIECDQKKIDMAQYMQMYEFVKVIKGDIRYHLPYEDKFFNLMLDFSTLDHIRPEEIGQVFTEYNRILNDGGLFVLFSWCADIYKCGKVDKDYQGPENQYFFLVKDVREKLQQKFDIIEEEKGATYPYEGTHIFMYRFLGRKNG